MLARSVVLLVAATTILAATEKEEKKGTKTEKKSEKADDVAHGFPARVNWIEWSRAVEAAREQNKPIMLLVHKTWCGACTSLKREFKTSSATDDFVQLSNNFVMVNVEDDDEPEDEKFAPDGGYIPRILFLDTDGEPLTTNNEKRYKNNKYFYPLVPQVVDGMKRAIDEFIGAADDVKQEAPTPPDRSSKPRQTEAASKADKDEL